MTAKTAALISYRPDGLPQLVALGVGPREHVQVPRARLAGAAPGLHDRRRFEEQSAAVVPCRLVVQALRRFPRDADSGLVDEVGADTRKCRGERDPEPAQRILGPDAAAKQDRRRAVAARRDDDGVRLDLELAAVAHDGGAAGAIAVEHHAVDDRLGEDGEVRPSACRIEIGEARVPAHRVAGVDRILRGARDRTRIVRIVDERDALLLRGSEHGPVPGSELLVAQPPCAQLRLGPTEARLELGERPSRSDLAPLVVVAPASPR